MKNKPIDTKALGAILVVAGLVCLAPLFLGLTKAHGLDVRGTPVGNGTLLTNLNPQNIAAGNLASGVKAAGEQIISGVLGSGVTLAAQQVVGPGPLGSGVLLNASDLRPGVAGTGAYTLPATSSLDVGSGGLTASGPLSLTGAASYLTTQSSNTFGGLTTMAQASVGAGGLTATASTTTLSYANVLGGANFGGPHGFSSLVVLQGSIGSGVTTPVGGGSAWPGFGLDFNDNSASYAVGKWWGPLWRASGYPMAAILGESTNASTYAGGALHFLTHATGDATLLERMMISDSGNVGIGTTNPGAALDVGGGMLKLKQMALAAIVAATPGATEVGGMVMCTDCSKTYSICVATGTTVQGFQLFGATSATECK